MGEPTSERVEGLTFIQCGGGEPCEHDFQGERAFEDGSGSEAVCVKCGIGAMEADQWNIWS